MKGIVFLPEVKAVSGTCRLDRGIIEAKDGRDLDAVLASAGTIQVLPKEALRPFGTARKAVETALLAKGTRFFGGYLVDASVAPKVHGDLQKIQGDFEQAKSHLLSSLHQLVEDRVTEAPEWEDVIRSNAPSVESLQEALRFSWIKTPIDLSDPEVEEVLKGDPLAIRIAREMAQVASTWLARQRQGQGLMGMSVLNQLRTKAKALSFVDGRLSGVVSALDTVIQEANATKGTPAAQGAALVIRGVIQTMASPANILNVGEEGEFADLPEMNPSVSAGESVPAEPGQDEKSIPDNSSERVIRPQPASAGVSAPTWAF